MSSDDSGLSLQDGMTSTGLTFPELWLRQLALGGSADALAVEAYVLGLLVPDQYQHDLLAQALNESCIERGGDHPVAYWQSSPVD